jgi:hypothetical protein
MVLLQNSAQTLPLAMGVRGLALIGPTLEVRNGGYSQPGSKGNLTGSAAAAIAAYAGGSSPITSVLGCADPHTTMGKRHSSAIDCAMDAEGFAAAVAAAKAASGAVVVSVGALRPAQPPARGGCGDALQRALRAAGFQPPIDGGTPAGSEALPPPPPLTD